MTADSIPTGSRPRTARRRAAVGLRAARNQMRRVTDRIPRRVRVGVAVLLVACAGTALGLQLGGRADADIGPFRVQLAAQPSLTGGSQLRIPPLGAISVASHHGPVRIVLQIDGLDETETKTLIADPAKLDAASDAAAGDISRAAEKLAARAAIAGLLGAVLFGLVVFRDLRRTALTGATALGLLLATGGITWATFNPAALREPRYEGLLTNVPALIGDARSIYDNYGEYRGQLIKILTNMSRVYEAVSSLPGYAPDPNTIRALHVSDLHNNPTAWSVIGTLSRQFQVGLICDTGDLTDWGSAAEANLYVQNIAALDVPYVFIRGNHDSADVAAAVAGNKNAVVLDDQVKTVAGLTIAGAGSTVFTPDKSSGEVDDGGEDAEAAGNALADTVRRYNRENAESVDVMMVHQPIAAEPLRDRGPLILAGHTHSREVRKLDDDTTLMIEGSTGAAGLRGLEGKTPKSFEMSVLYFTPEGALKAYDEITVSGSGQSQVSLRRVVVGDGITDSPSPSPSASVTATATATGPVTVTTSPPTPAVPTPSPTG